MLKDFELHEYDSQIPVVSVIIPVYNSEKWICETLESLLNQTLQNIEIICVDDGSTDSSPEVIKSYCNKDSRIKYYRQDHIGTGPARNKGMSFARGKYLSFLDADDLYDERMLEEMSNVLEKSGAEICICKAERFDNWSGKKNPYYTFSDKIKTNLYSTAEYQSSLFQMSFVPWNKMFLHSFILDNNIKFQNLIWANDLYFVCCALACSTSIYMINNIYISYRCNTGMSLQDNKSKYPLCGMEAWLAIREYLTEHEILTIDGRRSLDMACFDIFFSYFRRFVNNYAASDLVYEQLKYKLMDELRSNDNPYKYFPLKKKMKYWCIERISLRGLRWACQPVGGGKRFYSKLAFNWTSARLFIASIFYRDKSVK